MGAVQFKVLGPLEAVRDERRLGLGGRKPRAVLAVLLLEDGRHVRTDALVDALWGRRRPGPPRSRRCTSTSRSCAGSSATRGSS
jgi:DNA-binding SARP family transcriptional activator